MGAPSATHIGLSTLRMEPQFMIMGHAAGVAASLAVENDLPVKRVDVIALRERLLAGGARLDLT